MPALSASFTSWGAGCCGSPICSAMGFRFAGGFAAARSLRSRSKGYGWSRSRRGFTLSFSHARKIERMEPQRKRRDAEPDWTRERDDLESQLESVLNDLAATRK